MPRSFATTTLCLCCCWAVASFGSAGPSRAADQGLTGQYYRDGTFEYDPTFRLPNPTGEPAAVRIDPQIAFGKEKGFDKTNGQLVWWPAEDEDRHFAAIWTGYVRLPVAGTYLFPTVSDDCSAVSINHARVTLNGLFGGTITSDAFAYEGDHGGGSDADMRGNAYLVPVTVSEPTILPIEVRFATHNMGSHGFGIDLYWVTPDAPINADGKPVARLVPPEALMPALPEGTTVPETTSSGPHATISPSHFYLPTDGLTVCKLTVRLADDQGRPIAGHRVHVSVLSDYASPDFLTQPSEPTDENGIAVAEVKAQRNTGNLTFYATDLTDLVDVGQVGHVRVQRVDGPSFLPPGFAPYLAELEADPMPPVAGRPNKVRFPVHNPTDRPVEISARFSAFEWNVGRHDWPELGRVEGVVLQPGETRTVEGEWVPLHETWHMCFQLKLYARFADDGASVRRRAPPLTQFVSLDADLRIIFAQDAAADEETPVETRTRNLGAVTKACAGDQEAACDALDQALSSIDGAIAALDPNASFPTFKESLGEQLALVGANLCDNLAAQAQIQAISDRLATLDPTGGGRSRTPYYMALAGMQRDLEGLEAGTCGGIEDPCGGTTSGEEPPPSPQDNVALGTLKAVMQQAVDDGFAGDRTRDAKKAKDNVNKALGLLKQIKSAQCLPPGLIQATHMHIRDHDQASCNVLAAGIADWVVQLTGKEELRKKMTEGLGIGCGIAAN